MQTEIEVKFLDIHPDELRLKLRGLGAVQEYPERLMKRKTFDDHDGKMRKIGGWIRLRDEGDKITLSYKQLNDRTLHGTKEVTVNVNDFNTTSSLLEIVGFKQKSFQETKREKWLLDNAEITIDTWPWIPTFLEIEALDEKTVRDVASKLGFDWKHALHGSVEIVYQRHYDVTEAEVDGWETITFTSVPEWLEAKRIK